MLCILHCEKFSPLRDFIKKPVNVNPRGETKLFSLVKGQQLLWQLNIDRATNPT